MLAASLVQLRFELLVCDRSVSVKVIRHTFAGLKCLTETKIQILCDHVHYTRFHIVEMSNDSIFVSPYCWTKTVRQFDPSHRNIF